MYPCHKDKYFTIHEIRYFQLQASAFTIIIIMHMINFDMKKGYQW